MTAGILRGFEGVPSNPPDTGKAKTGEASGEK